MRIIGMDIHRVAAEVVALHEGAFQKLGRIPSQESVRTGQPSKSGPILHSTGILIKFRSMLTLQDFLCSSRTYLHKIPEPSNHRAFGHRIPT
jgi:hypothetical protein